jgi:hypothetical protein
MCFLTSDETQEDMQFQPNSRIYMNDVHKQDNLFPPDPQNSVGEQ